MRGHVLLHAFRTIDINVQCTKSHHGGTLVHSSVQKITFGSVPLLHLKVHAHCTGPL